MRNPVRPFAASALVVAVALLGSACNGGDDSETPSASAEEPTTSASADEPTPPAGEIELSGGEETVEIIGEPIDLPRKVVQDIIGQTQLYVDMASIDPLLGNDSGDDFESLFFFTIAPRVGPEGPDRAALTDEALPLATTDLETKAKPVTITALSDGFGGWVMVAAGVDYTVSAEVDGGPVTINRSGDLYFVEDPDSGDWKISAYDIGVSRITDEGKTSATADAGNKNGGAENATTAAPNDSEEAS